jgi:hypothetical protein
MDTLITRYKDKLDRKDDRRRLKGKPLEQNSAACEGSKPYPKYFADPPATLPPPLVKPVFIPQRRQADRLRGFQLLYAPDLAASGVTEPEFVHFLNTLNAAIGFDNKVKILNFAVDVGTLACSSWEVLVATIGAQALTTTAMHVKSRAKSQAYIAHANQRYFHPRGLHAQIVPVSSVHAVSSPSNGVEQEETALEPSTFQFSLGSPNVLPLDHPKAKGGLLNLNKRPIDYDPFDYGPGYVRILPHQYAPIRPSQIKTPSTTLVDKMADKVESYNVWQDRLPAKKSVRREKKRQDTIGRIRCSEGEAGVLEFLRKEEARHEEKLDKNKLQHLMDRNKVILVVVNLDSRATGRQRTE